VTWHPDMPQEYRNQIVTGDARVLAERIPDESVNLIFTDPVYDRIDDYRWLAETAKRVLVPSGALLIWSNGKWHKRHTDWLEDRGLVYRDEFAHVQIRYGAAFDGRIIRKCNRVLWFDLGETSELKSYVIDGFAEPTIPGGGFHWAKSSRFSSMLIEAFLPGVVFDPFCGRGTIPAMTMRSPMWHGFLAFEVSILDAELARAAIRNTQPLLFSQGIEQAEFEFN